MEEKRTHTDLKHKAWEMKKKSMEYNSNWERENALCGAG